MDNWEISTQELIEDSGTRRKLQQSSNDKELTCNKCEFKTTSNSLLNRHMTKDHKNSQEPVVESSTNEKKNAKNPYVSKRIKCDQCDQCDKKFNKKERFNSDMKSVHNNYTRIKQKYAS